MIRFLSLRQAGRALVLSMALLALASTARADGVPAGGQRTLHVLTVGITEYPGRNRLPFAAKDARDLARVLKD